MNLNSSNERKHIDLNGRWFGKGARRGVFRSSRDRSWKAEDNAKNPTQIQLKQGF